ncbi:MAG TPA: TIGR03986 family CRISPR-associated RAMP protein [Syntrophorhabdaceae bacterium]|nr:TIGR03986 family CRISPR-associated RAMP protein [Syntrophorhabdaceae bacterium]
MEKARLKLEKTKKGDYAVTLLFESGTKMSLSFLKLKDNKLNDKEVEVLREKGVVKKIICEGVVRYDKTASFAPSAQSHPERSVKNSPQDKAADKNSTSTYSNKTAVAPYNFVPLNAVVVPAEKLPDLDTYHQDRFTGYIDLEIETKTPLYIRDTLTDEEGMERDRIDEQRKANKSIPPYCNPDFFSPGGKLRIPGSSLRGMIRTMVEMTSFGRFDVSDDLHFHFRSFADKSLDLREQYSSVMIDRVRNAYSPTVEAGYLEKKGLKYIIKPAKSLDNCQYFRVEENDVVSKKICAEMKKIKEYRCATKGCKGRSKTQENCSSCGQPLKPFYEPNDAYKPSFKKVKFKYAKPDVHQHSVPLYYAKVTEIWSHDDESAPQDAIEGYLVLSNWMRGQLGKDGKHLHWVIGLPNNDVSITVPENVLRNYKNDKNRDSDTDLLKYFEDGHRQVPCFYMKKNNTIVSFGHTGFFRMAYEHSASYLLPQMLKTFNGIDIAEAIFGSKDTPVGRVFFEDAFCQIPKEQALLDMSTPKILSSPKPTTFQHYLEQDKSKINVDLKKNVSGLKTYNDSDAIIRGYKLYWHKDGTDWQETDAEKIQKHKSQYTQINPVKPNVVFIGRIRFENLSEVELGALLFALDLPDGCCHKLGMGKPLGLGSIKITPRLYISDRLKRYSTFSSELIDGPKETTDLSTYKKAFEKYVLTQIGDRGQNLWETDRLKELKAMLDFDNKPSNEKTRYMEIERPGVGNEFKNRPVLPRPMEVI